MAQTISLVRLKSTPKLTLNSIVSRRSTIVMERSKVKTPLFHLTSRSIRANLEMEFTP